MRRWHVVCEVFVRDRWEERMLSVGRRNLKFKRDAEAIANYLHAIRISNSVRYRVARRTVK